jgi:hypothetical protein
MLRAMASEWNREWSWLLRVGRSLLDQRSQKEREIDDGQSSRLESG